jgi:hypothetical protein
MLIEDRQQGLRLFEMNHHGARAASAPLATPRELVVQVLGIRLR